jgi:hypothetical protein
LLLGLTRMPDEDLKARLEVVERLTSLFRLERMLHLGVTCLSLVILLSSAVIMIGRGKAGTPELTLMFGSSGLITYSANRLLYMWARRRNRVLRS